MLKNVNPGQPIRLEPVKSCFEPLDSEKWQGAYTVSLIEFGGTEPFGQH
jgi:N-acyl-D-glutamate deacylase